jgi:hypothetical protein
MGRIVGNVRYKDGTPVPRCRVKIAASNPPLKHPAELTDAHGRFVFERLPSGWYEFEAAKALSDRIVLRGRQVGPVVIAVSEAGRARVNRAQSKLSPEPDTPSNGNGGRQPEPAPETEVASDYDEPVSNER